MAGRLILGIRLRFHDHAPEQAAVLLAFHQFAADQFRGNDLCRTAEEGLRQSWKTLGDVLGGYESGSKTEIADLSHSRNIT